MIVSAALPFAHSLRRHTMSSLTMVNETQYLCDRMFSYDDTLVVGVIPLLSALIQIASLCIVGVLYWHRGMIGVHASSC
jgi:hypothetical protein